MLLLLFKYLSSLKNSRIFSNRSRGYLVYSIIGIQDVYQRKFLLSVLLKRTMLLGKPLQKKDNSSLGNMLNYWKKKLYLLNTWFWNDYSALHYTLLMIKKSKLIVDVNEAFRAPLIYLFKTFNWKSIKSFRLSKTYHLRSCIVVFYHHSHLQVVKWLIIKSQPAHKTTQFVAKSPEKLSIPLSGWYLEYRTTLNLH